MERIAVVTGANRGIGLEVTRQLARRGLRVVLTSREEAAGRAAQGALAREGIEVETHALDVTRPESIDALARWIEAEKGGLDVLVNNAGIALQGFDGEVARKTLDANFFGPLHVTDRLLPLVRRGGRVVMVTSGLGDRSLLAPPLRARFERPLGRDELVELMNRFVSDVAAGRHAKEGWPTSAYSVSKIGLNALTALYARELANDPRAILVNAACPGWVRTRMGGAGAPLPVEQGADTPVWLALLPDGEPTGEVFRDRKQATW